MSGAAPEIVGQLISVATMSNLISVVLNMLLGLGPHLYICTCDLCIGASVLRTAVVAIAW